MASPAIRSRSLRRCGFLASGALAALAISACGSSSSGSGNSASSGGSSGKSKGTIYFVPGIADNVFYEVMEAPAKAEAAKLGYKLVWDPPADFSVESETPILQSILAKKPAALIVTPDDPVAMYSPIERFVQEHIPVMTIDTTLNNSSTITSAITSDNAQGGALAAKFLAKQAHDQGGTFTVEPTSSTTTTVQRGAAYLAGIKKLAPSMTSYGVQYDNNDLTQATTLTASELNAHKNITAIFGSNNVGAEGASRALKEQHNTKVDVVAYDADPTEVGLLKSGAISALIMQQPRQEAITAVEYAADALDGHKSSIKHLVKLPNIIATKANENKPSISKYFYTTK